jgi:hypothetical protein
LAITFPALMLLQACNRQAPAVVAPAPVSNAQPAATISTNSLTPEDAEALIRLLAHPLPREQVGTVIRLLTGADMPTNATDVSGFSRRLFTELIDIRFTCTTNELHALLAVSPHLPDILPAAGLGVLYPSTKYPWWQPEDLKNTRGFRDNWKHGADTVSCAMLAGESGVPSSVIVYFSFVLETVK